MACAPCAVVITDVLRGLKGEPSTGGLHVVIDRPSCEFLLLLHIAFR